MIKQLLIYTLVFFGLYTTCLPLHEYLLEENGFILPFSLQKVYAFQMGFSVLICVNFLWLSTVDKIFPQLGFIYLIGLFLKIVLFCIIFYNSIFNAEELSKISRISLLIPTLLFLLTEAFFVAKILNKKETPKIP